MVTEPFTRLSSSFICRYCSTSRVARSIKLIAVDLLEPFGIYPLEIIRFNHSRKIPG